MKNVSRIELCSTMCLLAFAAVLLFPPRLQAAQIEGDDTLGVASDDALSNNDMADERGAAGDTAITVTSDQVINATSTGNTVNVQGNLTNGSITTGDNFGGSGIGSYVMNTGNNATINSGVSLSVLMAP